MGLPAAGVWGMKLSKDDKIVGGGPLKSWGDLVLVTEKGWGKRTDVNQFSTQGRNGQGVIALPTDQETGQLIAAAILKGGDRLMTISARKNSKTVYARAVSKLARTHKGKPIMAIRGNDSLARLVTLEM